MTLRRFSRSRFSGLLVGMLAKSFFLVALSVAFALPAYAHVTEKKIPVDTCFRYNKFKIQDVRRKIFGPQEYDLIFYDLQYRQVDRYLLLYVNAFGEIVTERELIRETNLEKHFEISARVGDENTIARDVRAYLGSNEIHACAK